MARIVLTDGSGRWFNDDSADSWTEDTYHDGNNWISAATGSQWEHETLYRTINGGRWILNHRSQYQGSKDTYVIIDNDEAAVWLSKNNHKPHEACAKEYGDLEIE